jgi:hypothetical protein
MMSHPQDAALLYPDQSSPHLHRLYEATNKYSTTTKSTTTKLESTGHQLMLSAESESSNCRFYILCHHIHGDIVSRKWGNKYMPALKTCSPHDHLLTYYDGAGAAALLRGHMELTSYCALVTTYLLRRRWSCHTP